MSGELAITRTPPADGGSVPTPSATAESSSYSRSVITYPAYQPTNQLDNQLTHQLTPADVDVHVREVRAASGQS